jgi:hypothetical protein
LGGSARGAVICVYNFNDVLGFCINKLKPACLFLSLYIYCLFICCIFLWAQGCWLIPTDLKPTETGRIRIFCILHLETKAAEYAQTLET